MARSKLDHSQGDTGSKPPDGTDFKSGDVADPQHFDWLFYNVPVVVDGHADEFDRLDSNDDGVVDEADYANDSDASSYKGNDIDSDGDGVVDQADSADSATDATNVTSTYKGNDIDSNGDGTVDSADSADDATNVTATYKGNDIDSNGDGTVDEADDATNVTATYKGNDIDTDGDGTVDAADDAGSVDGRDISAFDNGTVTAKEWIQGSNGTLTDSIDVTNGTVYQIELYQQASNANGTLDVTYTLNDGSTVSHTLTDEDVVHPTFMLVEAFPNQVPPVGYADLVSVAGKIDTIDVSLDVNSDSDRQEVRLLYSEQP